MKSADPVRVPLTSLFATVSESNGVHALAVTPDWMQGRTVFGGIQSALAVRAMRARVPEAPLRTLQGTFFAPVPLGTMRARAQVLRTGKSATHVEARLVDGDTTLALLIGVFGAPRASTVSVVPRQPPVTAAARPLEFGYVPNLTPAFMQHFRARYLVGRPPFSGDTGVDHVLALDLLDPGPAGDAHVLCVADFFPPIALSHLKAPSPGSTLTWMMEFFADRVDGLPLDGWRVDGRMFAARDGYLSQSVMVWGPGGIPVAISRQSMVVFG